MEERKGREGRGGEGLRGEEDGKGRDGSLHHWNFQKSVPMIFSILKLITLSL